MAILRSPHAHDDDLRLDFGTALDREAERMITAGQTRNHKEALRAFAERREPKFRSRLRRTAAAPIHTQYWPPAHCVLLAAGRFDCAGHWLLDGF